MCQIIKYVFIKNVITIEILILLKRLGNMSYLMKFLIKIFEVRVMLIEPILQGTQAIIFPQDDYAKFMPFSAHNLMCKKTTFNDFKYLFSTVQKIQIY